MQRITQYMLLFSVFILLFATYFHSISAVTQDLGRHILMGEIIWETQSVPKTNLLSYTNASFPFINHHWLSEVFFFLIYSLSGFNGTLLVTAICSITAFLLLFFHALKKADAITVSFVSFLSLGILYERTDVRPESFSMLLFALFLFILFQNREKETKWLFVLIPLQFLWTNMHVYFIIGIVTVFLFFLDSIVSHRKELLAKRIPKQTQVLFFVLVCCALATLANPNGISGALYPFHVFDNYGYQIEENQNVFFMWEYAQKQTIVFFWASVVLLFTVLSIRAKHTRPIDWLFAVVFTILSAQAIRNLPLFAFASFIPFTYHLSVLLSPFFKKSQGKQMLCVLFLLLLFFWQFSYVVSQKPISFVQEQGAKKAADFVITHGIKGPFFNNFDIGSYFLFRLYPKEKVFVDGRPEAYPAVFFHKTYIPMQQDPKLFAEESKKYRFNAIFFSHMDQTPWASTFLQDIVKNKTWRIAYLDETVIILTKDASVPTISLADFNTDANTSKQSLYQLVSFFQKIGNTEKEIELLQDVLKKDPHDCVALAIVSQLFSQTQNPAAAIYQTRYGATCL